MCSLNPSWLAKAQGCQAFLAWQTITCPGWWNTHHGMEWSDWSNAFYRPKFISLLGLDLSLYTGHWVLVSFRIKLAPASSVCQGSIMEPGIQWILNRHILTSGFRVWGTFSFLIQSYVLTLCCGSKFPSQGIMGDNVVQIGKECTVKKKTCLWPRRAYKEFFFLFMNKIHPVGDWPPITSYVHKIQKNRRLLGINRHRLVRATQKKTFGLY